MASSLVGTAATKAAQEAARRQALLQLKKGKTNEQKDCIDYFTSEPSGGCGCLRGKSAMTMDEYVAKVQEKCRSLNLRAAAINRLGIDEEEATALIDPICLYNFDLDLDNNDLWWRYENNKVVSSRYTVTWLFFSEEQVYRYAYTFDMTSDDVWEYCEEFFYKDIVCFETEHDIREKIDTSPAKGCLGGETVKKNNFTVDIFRITVPGKVCKVGMRDAGTQKQSIQAAKALLREKKMAK